MLSRQVDLWEAALFYSFMRLGYPKTNPGLSEGRKRRLKHRDMMGMAEAGLVVEKKISKY